ncbi:MAG: nucleotidyltransferase family protein [Candidatus Pacearchaeota archaeon]
MKTLAEIKKILNDYKEYLYQNYGVKEIYLFGSYVRNEQKEDSDLDLLVQLEKPIGLKFVELGDFLEKILDMKIDVLTFPMIEKNPYLLEEIRKELINV